MRRVSLAFIRRRLYAVRTQRWTLAQTGKEEPGARAEGSSAPLTGVATQCFHAVTGRVRLRPDDPGTRSTHHCNNPNPARAAWRRSQSGSPNYASPSGSAKHLELARIRAKGKRPLKEGA